MDTFCYHIGKVNDEWITVLNCSFGWESIEETGIALYKSLILSVGYFDDDIFDLYLIKEGKTIASHLSGIT